VYEFVPTLEIDCSRGAGKVLRRCSRTQRCAVVPIDGEAGVRRRDGGPGQGLAYRRILHFGRRLLSRRPWHQHPLLLL